MYRLTLPIPVWAVLSLSLLWPLTASADLTLQRAAFVAADKALTLGDRLLFRQTEAALKDYPLYPYLRYRDLSQRLDMLPVAEVRRFLDDYAATPLASRLRKAWLSQLAGRERWRDFLRDYRPGLGTALDCQQRRALLAVNRPQDALDGLEQLWLTGRSQPTVCDPLFALWGKQGGFTPQRVWQRFALALEAGQPGLARYLVTLLPKAEQPTATLWLSVHEAPRSVLDTARFDAAHPRTAAILLHGIARWSRQDSVTAAAALDTLNSRYRLPAAERAPLEKQLALYLASRAQPDALARLDALPATQVDEAVEEWRVRVGLQRRDWARVLRTQEQMRPALRDSAQWRYWRARALEAQGQTEAAHTLYRELATERDYHGFLAADRLGLPYRLNDTPHPVAATELDRLAALPGLQRAQELFLLNRDWEARSEWQQATADFTPAQLSGVARLAQRWNESDLAITTLARAGEWDDLDLRFPLPHRAQVVAYADSHGLDPAWVYAVMRQESLFRSDARSPAGALGLMQLMPATGQRMAEELRVSYAGQQTLLHADTNIRFGTRYLRHTLDRLQDNPLLATAAYNAGPNRVADWLPQHGTMEADLWIETIPFMETRDYVKRVLEYATIYAVRLGQTGNSLAGRMSAVQPGS